MPDPTTLTTEELLRYVDTTDPVTGELAKRLEHAQKAKELLGRMHAAWAPSTYRHDYDEELDVEAREFLRG